MTKKTLKFIAAACAIIFCGVHSGLAQPSLITNNAPWTPKTLLEVQNKASNRRIEPLVCQIFELDMTALRRIVAQAPMERTPAAKNQPIPIEIPLADGKMLRFGIFESPIMAKELTNRYPNIRTYAGQALTDPLTTIRFDITPQGFHAMILSQQHGTIFIDPLYHNQDALYQVYAKKDFIKPTGEGFNCTAQQNEATILDISPNNHSKLLGDCKLHTYRLALSCNGEYAAFHGNTKPSVLGAMVTTMNRINGVFEKDFAVRMQIIPNNDTLIFLNAQTDPFSTNFNLVGDENQIVTDSLIGSNGYDVGHVFGQGGGGYAGYAVVCNPNLKALGYTGYGGVAGDPFDIDYVAHEIGHQFSGDHPHHGCGNNGISPGRVEPGSGSTIMAYAGICGVGNNVQNVSDAYFHGYNLDEMSQFIVNNGGQACGTHIQLSNNAPIITNNNQNYTIPIGTPFSLTATATDPDGNPITYCWEQFDSENGVQPPLSTNTKGPLFRTILPTPSPTRYFPALSALASGGPFNWEVLPTVSRDMNFRVSVRDNALGGGCSAQGNLVKVSASAAAGPFVITNPNAPNIIWTAGGQQTVYWNTANTQFAPVNCTAVNILLSTDGGLTYPTTLASGVPNFGFYPINVPALNTSTARIMVVGANNIFFDVSNNNFSITTPGTGFSVNTNVGHITVCGLDVATIITNVNATGGFLGNVGLQASGLPQGLVATFDQTTVAANGQTNLNITGLSAVAPGIYTITITGTGVNGSKTAIFALEVSSVLPTTPIRPLMPVNGAVNAQIAPLLVWNQMPAATTYTIQIADNANFMPVLSEQIGINTNQYQVPSSANLNPQTTYYWRAKASNSCGVGVNGTTHRFTTAGSVCTTLVGGGLPQFIDPLIQPDTATAVVYFPINSIVTDVNIPVLIGTHDYMRDVRFLLNSPSGTTLLVGGPICEGEDNFNFRFDDQAAAPHSTIPCPPTNGGLYQPRNPLGVFNGENTLGNWSIDVIDIQAPDGGSLTDFSLEICYPRPINTNCLLNATATINSSCTPCTADVGLNITGATGTLAYLWSNGTTASTLTNVCEGSYTVRIVDSMSCEVVLQINVIDTFMVNTSSTPAQGTNNGTATAVAVGGTAPFSYLWSTGDTTAALLQVATGNYTVIVTDAEGCTATATIFVGSNVATQSIPGLNTFTIMPNPTQGQFQALIDFEENEEIILELVDVLGRVVERKTQSGARLTVVFDLTNQSEGVFFLSLRTAKGSAKLPVVLVK